MQAVLASGRILGFMLIGMLATALLWFASPGHASLSLALILVAIANVAVAFSTMFSNAMLPDIVSGDRVGRLSGWAWALGYAGGLAALAIAFLAFVQPPVPLLGLDRDSAEHIRIVGPLVACWMGLFAWPLLLLTPDRPARHRPVACALRDGLASLGRTLSDLRARPGLLRFLLANMLYADGLVTLFALGGVYVSGTFGMSLAEVVVFGLTLNVTAGLGAFAFGWLDDRLGSRRTILLALAGLIVAGAAAASVQTRPWLWVTGGFLGIFVGPVQASSRALMARLAPADRQAEYFGLLALSGKATSFMGPTVAAIVTDASGSQRIGLATILVFLVAGFGLLATGGRDDNG